MKVRRLVYRYIPSEKLLELENRIHNQIDKAKCEEDIDRLLDHSMDIFFAVLWKNRHNKTFIEQSCDRVIEALGVKRGTSSQ